MEMTYIDAPADLTMQIGEAMFTQRAIRRLRPDKPVSDGDLKTILDAASKAPNGGNTQPAALSGNSRWRYDQGIRQALPRGLVGEAPR